MKPNALAIVGIVVGLGLMLGGPLVARFTPRATFWSDEDQRVYSQASVEFHDASYGGGHDHSNPGHLHGGPTDDEARSRLEAAKAEFTRQRARLSAAQGARGWITTACRGVGIIVAAVGVAVYLRTRRAPER